MTILTITTYNGEVVETIDIGTWNLDKPIAAAILIDNIKTAVEIAKKIDTENSDAQEIK